MRDPVKGCRRSGLPSPSVPQYAENNLLAWPPLVAAKLSISNSTGILPDEILTRPELCASGLPSDRHTKRAFTHRLHMQCVDIREHVDPLHRRHSAVHGDCGA